MIPRIRIHLLLGGLVFGCFLAVISPPNFEARSAFAAPAPPQNQSQRVKWTLMTSYPAEGGTSGTISSKLRFGIYPGGSSGEIHSNPVPNQAAVISQLTTLAGEQSLIVHLYTGWSWYDPGGLDDQIQSFSAAGLKIVLTIKYSPPPGHQGDLPGYQNFVRSVVDRYGTNPAMDSFVIGNEANAYGNSDASDGPFAQSHAAVASGVMAARQEALRIGTTARVGMNFGLMSADADAAFLGELATVGGSDFTNSVQFIGIDFYPGLWAQRTDQPYADMQKGLEQARATVDRIAGLRGRPIDIIEIGALFTTEADQANLLQQYVQATIDNRDRLQIASLNWFDLWDADSASADPFAHDGLLHTDLSPKPAFQVLQRAIAANLNASP